MRSLANFVYCIALLLMPVWSQNPPQSTQELLANAKQVYIQEGPTTALPKFEEALKRFRTEKDRHGEALSLGYVANCYRKLENLDKALEYGQQALHMKEELGDRDEIGKTHNQLGLYLLGTSELS